MAVTFKVRPVKVDNADEAWAEIERIGATDDGCLIMAPKAVHYVLKVTGVDFRQASILKQEMLARGAEAAVAKGVINHTVEHTDVLLMGTLQQYGSLMDKLKKQSFNLPELAEEIRRVLYHLEIKEPFTIDCRGRKLAIGRGTVVMGILNVTPDSFSDGGQYMDPEAALQRAREMVSQGAEIIDVGAESTRPGYEPVTAEEEIDRLMPVLEALLQDREIGVPISVDTSKAEVARRALDAGAHMINDQRALEDEGMAEVVASAGAPVVLMHHQDHTAYRDLLGDIVSYLQDRVEYAVKAGIAREKIIVDPGLGFGKTVEQNLAVVRQLFELKGLGRPILVGPSRKSMIGKVLDLPVDERVEGTAATVALAIANGADIVRVHDVKEMVRVAKMADAIVREG
ncbi:MAG: dihydropteroate synthase [Peptococcaceae bacterium]|nr:dihydropteroate synthase [Peptococcaceae bacterium]